MNLFKSPTSWSLSQHDTKVLAFHSIIGIIQIFLIGLKIENPGYAPMISTFSEFLRRLAI